MSAITEITAKAAEKGTFVFTAVFTDEDGNSVIPNSITWTLTDIIGTVINSRLNVAVAVPAASIDIVLRGLDLKVVGRNVKRVVTIKAIYNSSYGSNLPLNGEARFDVDDLLNIT